MRAVFLIIGFILISTGSITGNPLEIDINNNTEIPSLQEISTVSPGGSLEMNINNNTDYPSPDPASTVTTEITTITDTPPTTIKPITTTTKPITTSTKPITTSTKPTEEPTEKPLTTESPHTSTVHPPKERHFDGPSFFGGIILAVGLMAIGLVVLKFYKARAERNYHTL